MRFCNMYDDELLFAFCWRFEFGVRWVLQYHDIHVHIMYISVEQRNKRAERGGEAIADTVELYQCSVIEETKDAGKSEREAEGVQKERE